VLCAYSGALRYEVADVNVDAHHYRDDRARLITTRWIWLVPS
jgi:hypothetical protein